MAGIDKVHGKVPDLFLAHGEDRIVISEFEVSILYIE
jgi:hypothetical protein